MRRVFVENYIAQLEKKKGKFGDAASGIKNHTTPIVDCISESIPSLCYMAYLAFYLKISIIRSLSLIVLTGN